MGTWEHGRVLGNLGIWELGNMGILGNLGTWVLGIWELRNLGTWVIANLGT